MFCFSHEKSKKIEVINASTYGKKFYLEIEGNDTKYKDFQKLVCSAISIF
tara:strand:+ start:975 stop:1124 length:150 start_codon:yes stop_codon:yes gene_type:complete